MSTTFWIQFIGALFGMFMIYVTFIKFKRKELLKTEFLLWFIGWVIFIMLALMPSILDPVINTFNFYRRLDFFVVVGFFALLALSFYNYSIVKRTQKRVELLVRKMAIKEQENHSEKDYKTFNKKEHKTYNNRAQEKYKSIKYKIKK